MADFLEVRRQYRDIMHSTHAAAAHPQYGAGAPPVEGAGGGAGAQDVRPFKVGAGAGWAHAVECACWWCLFVLGITPTY